jgi:antitoxin component YwqK of YwqJK toxin-antitoxin module
MYNHEITELYPNLVKKKQVKENKTKADQVIPNPYLDYTLFDKATGETFSGKLAGKNNSGLDVEYVFEDGRLKLLNTYNREGGLKYRMNYHTGHFFELHPNGKLKQEIDYNTMWTATFYEDGSIRSESNDEFMFTYYQNGQLEKKYELATSYDEQNKSTYFHGDFEYYYPDGTIKAEGEYTEEEVDGTWTYYDEHGNVQKQEYFDKGFRMN